MPLDDYIEPPEPTEEEEAQFHRNQAASDAGEHIANIRNLISFPGIPASLKEAVIQAATAAIAEIQAELTAMTAERDRLRDEKWAGIIEIEAQRDAAQAELKRAREERDSLAAAVERLNGELETTKVAHAQDWAQRDLMLEQEGRIGKDGLAIGATIPAVRELVAANEKLAAENAALKEQVEKLATTLEQLLRRSEIEKCQHEETHRGGAIWTICDRCGRKWADDEGGFQPYEEPVDFANARAAIDATKEGR